MAHQSSSPTKYELINLLADINDRWYNIGVSLKVPQSVLNGLSECEKNNTYKLDQVIDSWLTTTKPHLVTWETVIDAIEGPIVNNIKKATEIREHLTREDIDITSSRKRKRDVQTMELEKKHQKYDLDTACQMLQKHSDRISSLTLPVEIVQMLYTERVISKETLDEVNRLGGVLGDGPLRGLHTTVYEDPSKLKVLASILLESKQTVPVANDILKEYEQTFPSHDQIKLHRTYQYNFDQMKVTFGNLIVVITPLIKAVIPSLDDLKIYLRRCFPELRPQLSIAKSFDDVMDLVQDKCTIINICCLEAVVNHYNITEAKSHIKEFKKVVDTFCETVKVSICLKKSFKLISRSHHLICETIEFILEWEVDEYTLKHIKDLLSKAFEDMAESVQVRTIKEGRSIIVACYAPRNMMDILLVTAEENLGLLKEMGLLKLTIGYDIIYDKCQRDKEVRPIVEENTKELRNQLELRQTISKKMTLQISSVVQKSEERKQKKEKGIKDLTSHLKWKEVIKEELLSVSAEKQNELETVQEVITSLMLLLRERNKQFEALRQNLKDLAFVSKVHKPVTDQEFEETETKSSQEESPHETTDVSNLLSRYGLQYEELDKECDDDDLIIKASQSIDDFNKAGRFLSLSSQSLDEISQINDDVKRKTAVLWKWKGKNGSAATTIELVKAFLKMEKRDTAESILKYLSEKTTESIDSQLYYLTPHKAKDRYPNWECLTPSEKEGVRNKLMIENHNVRKAYAVFVGHIMQSFIERKVDPNVVQSIAHSFGTLESISTVVFGFHENDSIGVILSKLIKHCSWFYYEPLKVIVKAVGNKTEKQYLETYEDKNLIPYLNRSIFEIPCASSHDQSRTNLHFIVSEDLSISGNKVKAVQLKLAKLLGCTHAILHFHNYNEGCNPSINQSSNPIGVYDLYNASKDGELERVKLSLKNGADVNFRDKNQETALHWASRNGYTDIVQLLLQYNADPNICDKDQWTALHWASRNSHTEIVQLLLKYNADPNICDNRTALYLVSRNGYTEIIQLLLQYNANPNICNKDQQTPLYWASIKDHTEIVQLLLQYNADPNICDKDQETALHWSSRYGHTEIVQLLLQHQANPNICNKDQETALHWVSRNGHAEIVQLLLQHQANPNICNKDQRTALYWASRNGHAEIVQLLLQHQANPNICNNDQETALHWASIKGHTEIALLLLQHQANPNIYNKYGETALHIACRDGHLNVISCLLSEGADVTVKNKSGYTPLEKCHYTIRNDIVSLFNQYNPKRILEDVSKWNIENVEEEQVFEKRDYGVMLVIPPSAVEKKEEVKTEVKVVTPEETDIILPPDVELVSCLYKIETTGKFSKPIELYLQHNVELTSQEECKQLAFIIAKGPPPYKFELLPTNVQEFRPYDNSGVVRLCDLSPVAVVYDIQKEKSALFGQPSCSYVVTVFVKQMKKSCWEIRAVVTKNLGPFLKKVKTEACFETWKRIEPVSFFFDPVINEVTITNEYYDIQPMINPFQVSKKVVDKCQPDTALPYLKFQAFLKDDKEVTDLKLSFKGMREETSLVIGSYDLQQIKDIPVPSPPATLSARQPTSTSTLLRPSLSLSCFPFSLTSTASIPSPVDNQSSIITLPITNNPAHSRTKSSCQPNILLGKVPKKRHLMTLLHPIKYKWDIIGVQLAVPDGDIKSAEYNEAYDHTKKLSEVLQIWIDKKTRLVCWHTIITAVEEPPVENKVVADDIYQFLIRPDIQNEYLSTGHVVTTFNSPPPIPQKSTEKKSLPMSAANHPQVVTKPTKKKGGPPPSIAPNPDKKEESFQVAKKSMMIQTESVVKQDVAVQFNYLFLLNDTLKNVCIGGEKMFLIQGNSPQFLNWEQYGLKIIIPEDTLSPINTCEVAVTAMVGGQFQLPEGSELISVVYGISFSKPLLKPVKLEIQHCAHLVTQDHIGYLSFARALVDQPALPYQFQLENGGQFYPGNQYGTIFLTHSCLNAIVKSYNDPFYDSNTIIPEISQPNNAIGDSESNDINSHFYDNQFSVNKASPNDFLNPINDKSPVMTSGVIDKIWSLPLSSTDDNKPFSAETVTESTSGACPQPTSQLPLSLNEQSSTNNSVKEKCLLSSSPDNRYVCQVAYEKLNINEWKMHFMAAKHLDALLEYIKKSLSSNTERDAQICFTFQLHPGAIELALNEEQQQSYHGWNIYPHSNPAVIYQTDVDIFGAQTPASVPFILITVSADVGPNTVTRLNYRVPLRGIKPHQEINIIRSLGNDRNKCTQSTTSANISTSTSQDISHSAPEVFRTYYAELSCLASNSNNRLSLANELFSAQLITFEVYNSATDNSAKTDVEKGVLLMKGLMSTINTQPQSLPILISVLKKLEVFRSAAENMERDLL